MLSRETGLTPRKLTELRPHLVNLNFGRFSSEGEWKTAAGDVDAIFSRHLERALADAKQTNTPLRILFFAHGGLVKESDGLEIAHRHLNFFLDNGIYPIFFVWETGLFETLGQLLRRAQSGARGFVTDSVTDPIIEALARTLGGPTIWGGMKLSAERAVTDENSLYGQGGAHYVATKLKAFCDTHADEAIELHAMGHSAGSIFHAHFLSLARKLNVPSFNSLQLLAPAVRVDTFKKLLGGLIGVGKGVDSATLFTMSKDYERNDNCALVYRKSLLYLIYYSLEPEKHTPILGLEQSLRADTELVALFGMASTGGTSAGEVVFSVTPTRTGRRASTSTTHGGFDDDAPTLGSALRRILGKNTADPIVEYVATRELRGIDLWSDQVDWPKGFGPAGLPVAPRTDAMQAASGQRKALCIGINQYPTAPLHGCVADAQNWTHALAQLGFAVSSLVDAQATRSAILQAFNDLIASSSPGDVLVIQYAGHGTQLPDTNSDESDHKDEALVPFDFANGAFLIDDDVREAFARLPEGVNLTCFFDCCHSGTVSRFAVGTPSAVNEATTDRRARYIVATGEMIEAHHRFRASMRAMRAETLNTQATMKNVSFAACQDNEVAYETNGHGDFTQLALPVLSGDSTGVTNKEFEKRVVAAFGAHPHQKPRLDCARGAENRPFLQPLASGVALRPVTVAAGGSRNLEAIALLEAALQKLRAAE